MKKKKNRGPYLLLIACLLALMSISYTQTMLLKGAVHAVLSPLEEHILYAKNSCFQAFYRLFPVNPSSSTEAENEIHRLQLENQLLHNQLLEIGNIVQNEALLHKQLAMLENPRLAEELSYLSRLRQEELGKLAALQLTSVPAQVILRSFSNWGSVVWINVGDRNNQSLGHEVIAKKSPVVLGNRLVGVVDYVGQRQSRVRLITDTRLTPSVRVMRMIGERPLYLAKGELRGSHQPEYRKISGNLKGVGFNYDYSDEAGEPRDLRTGSSSLTAPEEEKIPLIQPGDLLITTGMDGVFPRGLQVATVSLVEPLKEGDYYYTIEAEAVVHSLHDLQTVYVLPPLGYED